MKLENPRLAALQETLRRQIERLRNDGVDRERHTAEIRGTMEAMYAVDMEQRQAELDLHAAKLEELQASFEDRTKQRDQIIETRLEQLLASDCEELSESEFSSDLFGFPKSDVQLQIIWDKIENGTRKMKIHAVWSRAETRSREVQFTRERENFRSKVIDGKRIEFTVFVPEQRVKREVFQVQVPVWRVLEIDVPDGEDWEKVARQKLMRKSGRR